MAIKHLSNYLCMQHIIFTFFLVFFNYFIIYMHHISVLQKTLISVGNIRKLNIWVAWNKSNKTYYWYFFSYGIRLLIISIRIFIFIYINKCKCDKVIKEISMIFLPFLCYRHTYFLVNGYNLYFLLVIQWNMWEWNL